MAKSKKSKKIDLKDIIAESNATPVVDTVDSNPNTVEAEIPLNTESFDFSEEFNQQLLDYNANITNLDPDFTSIVSRSKFLVRVLARPLEKDENGVILPNMEIVGVPTKNGVDYVGHMENPFPYSQLAIVVSVPKHFDDIKVGDVVFLGKNPTIGRATGRADNAMIQIPQAFLHPLKTKAKYPPVDPSDPMYGYLSVFTNDIEYVFPEGLPEQS